MKKKALLLIFLLLLVLTPITYSILGSKKNYKKFYERQFNTKVVHYSDWQGNSREYHFENKLFIYLRIGDTATLRIGDSISKNKNTYRFDIYRKNNINKYEFFKNYDADIY